MLSILFVDTDTPVVALIVIAPGCDTSCQLFWMQYKNILLYRHESELWITEKGNNCAFDTDSCTIAKK